MTACNYRVDQLLRKQEAAQQSRMQANFDMSKLTSAETKILNERCPSCDVHIGKHEPAPPIPYPPLGIPSGLPMMGVEGPPFPRILQPPGQGGRRGEDGSAGGDGGQRWGAGQGHEQ